MQERNARVALANALKTAREHVRGLITDAQIVKQANLILREDAAREHAAAAKSAHAKGVRSLPFDGPEKIASRGAFNSWMNTNPKLPPSEKQLLAVVLVIRRFAASRNDARLSPRDIRHWTELYRAAKTTPSKRSHGASVPSPQALPTSEPSTADDSLAAAVHLEATARALPRLSALHYVNIARLGLLLLEAGHPVDLPDHLPADMNPMAWLQVEHQILQELRRVELPLKRYTSDFDLRSLERGDVLVFDTELYTRGRPPAQQALPLTGDLNHDPFLHFLRGDTRVIMPIDPQWITTGTARSEFCSRSTELMGMCLVKRQLRPGDGPLIGKNTQVLQYVASPLILGLCDPRHVDPELTSQSRWEMPSSAEIARQLVEADAADSMPPPAAALDSCRANAWPPPDDAPF